MSKTTPETPAAREERLRTEALEWRRGLKPGDQFCIDNTSRYDRRVQIFTVERTTPTQLIAERGHRFNRESGRQIGGNTYQRIRPVTQADHDTNEKAGIVQRFTTTKFAELDLATLRRLAAALDQGEVVS